MFTFWGIKIHPIIEKIANIFGHRASLEGIVLFSVFIYYIHAIWYNMCFHQTLNKFINLNGPLNAI